MATFFLTFLTNDREKRKREPLPCKTRERRDGIYIEREGKIAEYISRERERERKRAREVKRGRCRERKGEIERREREKR